MAVELIDGYVGRAHVSSADCSVFNRATYGTDTGVFNVEDKFACSIQSGNKVSIGRGAGIVNGLRFRTNSSETLTIRNGTSGSKRNDLIVARYAKEQSSGIESVSLVVVEGTPVSSNPADPQTLAGDLNLWRIPLDGISVGKPVALFETLLTVGSAIQSAKYESEAIKVTRQGMWCVLVLDGGVNGSNAWGTSTVCTLPENFRPLVRVVAPVMVQLNGDSTAIVEVTTDGKVNVISKGGNTLWGSWMFATAAYPAAKQTLI